MAATPLGHSYGYRYRVLSALGHSKTCPLQTRPLCQTSLDAGGAARHFLAAGVTPLRSIVSTTDQRCIQWLTRCAHDASNLERISETVRCWARVLISLRMLSAVTFFVPWKALPT